LKQHDHVDTSTRLRLRTFHAFALAHLPSAPARVLEVGCGNGELALALVDDGYDMTAIDPRAPDGEIFRATRLEDFDDADGFDAVVASVSLHHVESLDAAFAKIAGLLRPDGILVLEEFAKERIAGPTARWYFHQRQALAGLNDDPHLSDDFETWLAEWHVRHDEVHTLTDLRRALDERFVERHAESGPYLYDHWLHDAVAPLERALVDAGAIDAVGFRYVGVLSRR
jgi:SAM-dependent methyltransferase